MKLKTFLTTFLLFLLFFYLGIILISFIALKNDINSASERCLREHYFIVNSIYKDLNALKNRDTENESFNNNLFSSYVNTFGSNNIYLLFLKDDKYIYSNLSESEKFISNLKKGDKNNRIISIEEINSKTFIIVSGLFPKPYESYSCIYYYDLSDIIYKWNKTVNFLYVMGALFSILLAISLMLILNRIFKPLDIVSKTSKCIADGNYDKRMKISGKDEISKMAYNFNYMAQEIQNHIKELNFILKQKQQFIDNFAHELRTPLTSIFGYAEYIQKTMLTESEKYEASSYIMNESKRLQKIAYSLLNLAMLRNNKINYKKVNLEKLFKSTKQILYPKIIDKKIQFQYSYLINEIYGDYDLLESLIINLSDNAIKACNEGGKIIITAYLENEHKIIEIKDNGKGMTNEELSHITEAFYKADKSRNSTQEGAGLGLSLCEQIVLCHNAKLEFFSALNKGTTVKIYFTVL